MDFQAGPTFEDLSIDDDLSQLERIVRYSRSSIALQRLVHVKVKTGGLPTASLLPSGRCCPLPSFDNPLQSYHTYSPHRLAYLVTPGLWGVINVITRTSHILAELTYLQV